MAKDQVEVTEVANEQAVSSKIKVTFVMEVPNFLYNQQQNTADIRNAMELEVEKFEGRVLSVDIASVD